MTYAHPSHPITILFLGDSITHGLVHTRGARSFAEHVNETLRGAEPTGRKEDVLINSAVSGWRVPDMLAAWDFRAARFDPDVAFVMFGTNDATAGADGVPAYREGLVEMVRRLREQGAFVVLQTPPPVIGDADGRAQSLELYREAVREVAAEFDVPLADHARDWDEHAPTIEEWMDDEFHPNALGHLRMADLLLKVLFDRGPATASLS